MPCDPETGDDAAWKVVMPAVDAAEGEVSAFRLNGENLAVYRVDGAFYITDNICTHEWAELSDGLLEGCVIECPFHHARFDIRTGAVVAGPAEQALKCYAVRERDGFIEIRDGSEPGDS